MTVFRVRLSVYSHALGRTKSDTTVDTLAASIRALRELPPLGPGDRLDVEIIDGPEVTPPRPRPAPKADPAQASLDFEDPVEGDAPPA